MEQELKTVKDAADKGEVVEYKICILNEKTLGQKETPALEVVMKCKDSDGVELQKWLRHVIWGTEKGQFFIDKFTDKLGISKITHAEDGWHYKEAELKGYEGKCKLVVNDRGYPEVADWIAKDAEPVVESTIVEDTVIPF